MRHEIYSWLPPDPPMSGTIQLYHSELPVHTFALGICRVTIRLLHSSALVLMEHPICSTSGVFEERVEYITSTDNCQHSMCTVALKQLTNTTGCSRQTWYNNVLAFC